MEDGWADSIERYVLTLAARLHETEIPDKLGILKGIDTVGLHLAQREIFALSQTLAIPLENAQAVKLRVRLLSLFLTLHRCGFCAAVPGHPELPPDVPHLRPRRLPLVVRGLPPDRAPTELDLPPHAHRRTGLAVLSGALPARQSASVPNSTWA